MSPAESVRCARVRAWFGLTGRDRPAPVGVAAPVGVSEGGIVVIAGASGAGKSTLLRQMSAGLRARGERVIDVDRVRLRDVPVVDQFTGPDSGLEAALGLLSRVGLAEAWVYLGRPGELSAGQRWRLRLALAAWRANGGERAWLVCDEFAAVLDRITARAVARGLRRLVDGAGGRLSAIVATSHDDLAADLRPTTVVRCDFGEYRVVSGATASPPRRPPARPAARP